MFSQFKNALESVAQQPIRILDAESNGDNTSPASLSSSQLAESAMSSIRKSLASQRVSPAPDSATSPSPTAGTRKSTLEERLRRAAQASEFSASSSPATRGRPADVSKPPPNKPSSMTAHPGSKPHSRSSSPAPASKPPSRASSPAPASKPPSRTSSPAPSYRNTSSVQRAASPAPTTTTGTPSRPPSRSNSPTPTARARRASELVTKGTRAASPSPLTKYPSPLRRSSIIVNNIPLPSPPIATPSSTDPDDSKEALVNGSSEDNSLVSTGDEVEENEKGEPDPIAAGPTELSTAQSSSSQGADPHGQEDESQTQTQLPLPIQSSAESSDDVTADPSEPATLLQAEPATTEESTSYQVTDTAANVVTVPKKLQSTDNESVTDSSLAPVTQEGSSEVNSPPSDSEPNISGFTVLGSPNTQESEVNSPPSDSEPNISGLATTVLESPNVSTDRQETKQPNVDHSAEIEGLQARLKEVEQRFSDVSTSFQRLHVEKQTADAILKENSHLESFSDANTLRDYFANLRTKDEVFQGEIKRLTGKLELQDDQQQELRETHKLETQALSEEIRKMKTHIKETEILFEAAQRATTNVEEIADQKKEEILRLEKVLEQSKNLAKEEEEKRVKAITLLKTVRQKLVKAEKDREDVTKEMMAMREREKGDKDKDHGERLKLLRDLEVSQFAHAQETAALRAQFEKDLTTTRERYEQEISALKGQHELELATVKTSCNKELTSKSSQISALESSLNSVTRDKNAFFDQLQLRQGELESAQAHADTIQHQNTELEFQLREANDRFALIREEYSELQREIESRSREPTVSAEEIAKVVSAVEIKYEARLAEIKRNIPVLEQERHDSEVDWSKKLTEKVRELEELKKMLGSATRMRGKDEKTIVDLKTELETTQETNKGLRREVAEATLLKGQIEELERSLDEQEHETNVKIRVLEKQIDEQRAREAQLKQGNKNLREELRKVQSSAALLERQRNPGVSHWSTPTPGGPGSGDAAKNSSIDLGSSPSPADTPSSSAPTKSNEEVNFEYVRNVVLQFLEHKERRPQLVKVLSIILHLTPQETRRLIAKV